MHRLISRGYQFWAYVPSMPAAVVFMLIFLLITALHCWRMFKTKTWFCIAFTLGGLFEVIGYLGRCIAHNNTTTMGPYVLTNAFVLLGPTLFAASIYMALGRIIRRVRGEHLSIIRVSRLTKTFVWGDIISFAVQGNSTPLSVLGYAKWGKILVIVGLLIQLISFFIFWLTAIIFSSRIHRKPTTESFQPHIPWKKSLHMLYAVSALILVRSIFRIIEYTLGNDGYPLTHEWTLYIFDSVPMAIVMVVFFIWYPSQINPTSDLDTEGNIPLASSTSQETFKERILCVALCALHRRIYYFPNIILGGNLVSLLEDIQNKKYRSDEFIGYTARAAAHDKTGQLMPYIIQSVFVLLAPTLFAAAVYMVLARIIYSVKGEAYSPIPMRLITKLFVSCDIITFLIQGGGAGLMAKGDQASSGQDIVLAGLALQIVTFVVFLGTAIIFHRRMNQYPTQTSLYEDVPWKTHLNGLYIISAMILVRSIFRIIEYGMGNDGYLLSNEWPNYIFDAVPMLIAMVCFAVWHPSGLYPFLVQPRAQPEQTDTVEPKLET
ncbi:hypothetical protein VI817_004547 [Penicillium citrinum]|nr:hypothetical protein VI817_004547 [Penicillium citrinum]